MSEPQITDQTKEITDQTKALEFLKKSGDITLDRNNRVIKIDYNQHDGGPLFQAMFSLLSSGRLNSGTASDIDHDDRTTRNATAFWETTDQTAFNNFASLLKENDIACGNFRAFSKDKKGRGRGGDGGSRGAGWQ